MTRLMTRTLALLLLFAAGVCAQDFEYMYVSPTQDPAGWRSGRQVPETAVNWQWLNGDAGAQVLQDAGLPNLLRTYNDLRNDGAFRRAALQVIGIDGETIRVYLINDNNGISRSMVEFFGICDYVNSGQIYAWPCANDEPIRAIWIGEKNITDDLAGGAQWSEWQSVVLHELMHTQDRTEWTPAERRVRPLIGPEARSAYGADGTHYFTEILPNSRAAFMEGVANFIGFCWDNASRERFIARIVNNDLFLVEQNSAMGRRLRREIGNPEDTVTLNNGSQRVRYDRYRWNTLNLQTLVRNEVFIGLLLYYYAVHLPPTAGSQITEGGTTIGEPSRTGFQQVIYHFEETNVEDRNVLDLIGSIWDDADLEDMFEGTRNHLFVIAALDIMSNFSADRQTFERIMGDGRTISPEALSNTLDEYFSDIQQSGPMNRNDVMANIRPLLPNYEEAMQALGERFNIASYPLFNP